MSTITNRIFLMVLTVSLFSSLSAGAQTFNEWFRQKATQRKYLIQQIAALEVYKGYVKTGYHIVDGGLNLIKDVKNGDLSLHKNYFGSLKGVNPRIKRYVKVAATIDLQAKIIRNCRQGLKKARASGMLRAGEIAYMEHVFSGVLDDCIGVLDDLLVLITDGQAEMKDDQRLQRIEQLYREMQGHYAFTAGFSNGALGLALARRKELAAAEQLKSNYGITKNTSLK